jgi:mono/diheme cytochrome c family protein
MRTFVVVSIAAALLSSAAYAQGQGNAERGKQMFMNYGCYTCHGFEGQGVPGRKIAPNPLPYAAFSAYVRTSPGEMPTFTAKTLPDQDLVDIHAYLSTKPATPNPASVPLLQEIGR